MDTARIHPARNRFDRSVSRITEEILGDDRYDPELYERLRDKLGAMFGRRIETILMHDIKTVRTGPTELWTLMQGLDNAGVPGYRRALVTAQIVAPLDAAGEPTAERFEAIRGALDEFCEKLVILRSEARALFGDETWEETVERLLDDIEADEVSPEPEDDR